MSAGVSDGMGGVFDELTAAGRARFEHHAVEVVLAERTVIFDVGDPGDALYIIRSGLIDVTSGGAHDHRLVTLGPGDCFGEQALLTGRGRSARAVTQTGATLWRLDHADFLVLMASDPELATIVAKAVSGHLGATSRRDMGLPRGRTIVLAVDEGADAQQFVEALTAHCAAMLGEPAVVLVATSPSGEAPTLGPSDRTTCALDELANAAVHAVRDHGLVFVVCTGEVPSELIAGADHCVLTRHNERERTRDARAAHERRPPKVFDSTPDEHETAALAREVCGRRIGLALGSGGIRGWAHSGVLEVLRSSEIPIDFVSGASAGSLAGALFVAGMPPTAMLELPTIVRDVMRASALSYRPSLQAILSDRPFVRYIEDRIGRGALIEDLPTPFVVSTTDLDTRAVVYLRDGPVAQSVVASCAVNGVFPPVRLQGRRLVDGGASDPVPVVPLRELGADIVIAVNVMAIGRGAAGLYTPRLRIPLPGLVDNLMIGLDTVMTQAAVQSCRIADIVVEPFAAGARWYDVLPAHKYAAAGELAMRAELPRLLALLGRSVADRLIS